jgi:hypothetical protein
MPEACKGCGQLTGIPEYDSKLWDIYHRISDGRSTYEPLVFTGDWMQENIIDEEDHESVMLAMERDMANRGLCAACGRPDMRGVKDEDIMSKEDSQEMHDMWAIERQERAMGA